MITAHVSPDPDAVASVILLGTTLKLNYPDKEIKLVLEEEPANLDSLTGYDQIEFMPIAKALNDFAPQLFFLLDGNNYERCSRHDGQKIRDYLRENSVKTVVIDHHELADKDEVDIFINNGSMATAQDVYDICFHQLKLKPPQDYAQIAMVGLYADSGGFAYSKGNNEDSVFDLAKELVNHGAKIEDAKNFLSQYNDADIQVLNELLTNLSSTQDYTYSFLGDQFIKEWSSSGKSQAELKTGVGTFLNEYLRNIDGRQWGLIVFKNTLDGDDMYSVSFRAVNGVKDVAQIARRLDGGGHKPAAGGKVQAANLEDAIQKVKEAIAKSA